MMLLKELNEKQMVVESHINKLQEIIDNTDIQAANNITEFQKYNMLLDELNETKSRLDDIIKKKDSVQKEIDLLTWKREKIINSYERRDKDFDQL